MIESKFNEQIRFVLRARAREINRPILTGVLFEFSPDQVKIAGADGYRLHIGTFPTENCADLDDQFFVVDPTELDKLLKRKSACIDSIAYNDDGGLRFGVSWGKKKADVLCPIVPGKFPAYSAILPKGPAVFETRILNTVIYDSAGFTTSRWSFDKEEVLVTVYNSTPIKFTADITGQVSETPESPFTISVDPEYLAEATLSGERSTTFKFYGSTAPLLCSPMGFPHLLAVIMPMTTTE